MLKKLPIPKPVKVVTIVLLSVGLVGGTGYLLWDNYSQEGQTSTSSTTKTAAPAAEKGLKQYENDTYSFSYPDKGWSLEQGDETTGYHPTLQTDNLTSESFDVKTGATIYVRTFPASEGISYEELIKNPDGLPETIYTDIKKTKVAGQDAHSYTLNYEGTRYITEFARGETSYQITFQVAEDQKAQYQKIYDQVVASFKFK